MSGGFMNILIIALGLIVLVVGRRLFWLSVAIVGFLVGMEFTNVLLANQPVWVMIAGGLAAGLLGAVLALFAQRLAFSLAGFLAGAYLCLIVALALGAGGVSLLIAAVGGIIGAIAAAVLLDWAIIVLSCLVGAGAIVAQLALGRLVDAIVFIALVIMGIAVQTRFMPRSGKRSPR
jgi:hypothetical protein